MSNTPWVLKNNGGTFSQNWTNTALLTTTKNDAVLTGTVWDNIPAIVGYRGDDLTTLTGADPQSLVAPTATPMNLHANQTNPNTFGTGGVAEFEIANPTIALTGSGTADAPNIVIYLDTTDRQDITFTANVRDIDGSADDAIQQVAVQYRIGGTGNWVNLSGAYIADATLGGSATLVTPINVALPSIANNQALVEIRIITTNAVGNDEWVGIDDISVTSAAITVPQPGNFSINDVTVAEGAAAATTDVTFTVTRAGGSSGAATMSYTIAAPGTNGRAGTNDFVGGTVFSGNLSFADGETSKTITVTVAGDNAPEPNETFTVTLGTPSVGALTDGVGIGTITNDDGNTVAIYDIQGRGHTSGWAGQVVTTSGVVTAVDSNGFYLQDVAGDGDLTTSDAIFVFTSTAPTVAIGNQITITATVTEFTATTAGSLSLTELTAPSSIVVNTPSVALPAAILISGDGTGRAPPTELMSDGFVTYNPSVYGLDFWESMEGMRVTIKAPLVVADTASGETYVVASGGVGATGVNSRGGISISAGDNNPEKISLYDDANLSGSYAPNHSQGDILGDVTGVINYAGAAYEIAVTGTVTTSVDVTQVRETTNLVGNTGNLSYTSFNVENLDPTDPATKFQNHAVEIVTALKSPDIISLQEIQDADGAGNGTNYSGAVTAQLLIDAIIAAGGPTYRYIEIAPTANNTTGGEGNGNIRNGYLYNAERVSYVEGTVALITTPTPAYNNTRKPLVADFMFNGELFTAITLHSTSRGGSDPAQGRFQPPSNAGDSARTAQAAGVRAYIDTVLASDASHKFVVSGDLNGFYYEDAVNALTAGNVVQSLYYKLAVEERYSYQFEGNYQTLDHILVSGGLYAAAQFDVVHYNAGFTDGLRSTDHDQPVALVAIARAAGAAVANADVFTVSEVNQYRGTLLANDVGGGAGLAVTGVNGAGTVGVPIRLGSGALVTVNADGSFTYDSDGAFSSLAGGATATDSFNYAITGGSTATVTVTIGGVTNPVPSAANDTLAGTSANDLFDLSSGGVDTVSGGAGDDGFAFGASFTAADRVNGGSGTNDQVGLQGNYTGGNRLLLGANTLVNVEVLAILPGFDYDIVMHDANVPAGTEFSVYGGLLGPDDNFTFDGSAETNGYFRTFGGQGVETLTGSANSDGFYFGPNTWGASDQVTGGGGSNDQIGLDGTYTGLTIDSRMDVETVVFMPGPVGSPNIFSATIAENFVGAGQTKSIYAIGVTTSVTIDASGNTSGSLTIYGGNVGDTLTGGGGADTLFGATGGDTLVGGGGIDIFLYDGVSQSTGVNFDTLSDFTYGTDVIKITGQTHDSYGAVSGGQLRTSAFDADLAAAVAPQMAAGKAVFFTPNSGDYNGQIFLVVDANNDGVYVAGQDYVFRMSANPIPAPTVDFIIA